MTVGRPKIPLPSVIPGAEGQMERRPRRGDEEILAGLRRGDTSVAGHFYWRVRPVVNSHDAAAPGPPGSGRRGSRSDRAHSAHRIGDQLPGRLPARRMGRTCLGARCVQHIRRRRLERAIFPAPLEDDAEIALGVSASEVETAMLRQSLRHVTGHLCAMRGERAWTFLLHDVCGYSLDEVARICGVSVAPAQSGLVRGRRDLHEQIAADPVLAGILDRGEP